MMTAHPEKPAADLGPNQLAWLKANVPQFGPAKEAADRAIAHAAQVAARIVTATSPE